MDWQHPLDSLISLVTGSSEAQAAPPAPKPTITPATSYGISPTNYRFSKQTGKPIADLPQEGEETLDVYPTIHSIQPTKLNGGKPWAGQKVPTGYLDGLAYAHAKAESVGGFDKETLNQFLPLATRESRYKDYGNNGVNVDYKTPPPENLKPIITKADALHAEETRLGRLATKAFKAHNDEAFGDLVLKQKDIKMQREKLDNEILSDPNWKSRADSYHNITNKALQLGLKQSENQELLRDSKGRIISKVDVYRAKDNDPYSVKALHVPLALYNKMQENPGAKGLELTKRFVGAGEEAVARNKQEATILKNLHHPKNKPVLDYYNSKLEHHRSNVIKGKK